MPPNLTDYQKRLANITIGPTTLRNQGASGVVAAARHFLEELDFRIFITNTQMVFLKELDAQTNLLQLSFPANAQHWGTARKTINLFLAEASYHRFICEAYHLETIKRFLELPLDSQVGQFLTKEAQNMGETDFPRWPGLKYLKQETSKRYQDFAGRFARDKGWARVHLDVVIWQPETQAGKRNTFPPYK